MIRHLKLSESEKSNRVTSIALKKDAKRIGIVLQQRRKINPLETFNRGKCKGEPMICENCGKKFLNTKGHIDKYCSFKCKADDMHRKKYQLLIDGDKSILRANYSPRYFKYDIIKICEFFIIIDRLIVY